MHGQLWYMCSGDVVHKGLNLLLSLVMFPAPATAETHMEIQYHFLICVHKVACLAEMLTMHTLEIILLSELEKNWGGE